jgi:hypothetical protein
MYHMEATENTPRKMSSHQSLHLAQIRRLGGTILHRVVVADGRMYVKWTYDGRTRAEYVSREGGA